MCEQMSVCVKANKVHCLTVYNRLNEMGIKRGLHAFKVCRGLHMLLLMVEVRFQQSSYGERKYLKGYEQLRKTYPLNNSIL